MDYSAFVVYFFASIVIGSISFWAISRLWRETSVSRYLAIAGSWAIVCVVSYFIRVTSDSFDVFAWMTTLHLICIDFALFFFVIFTSYYTEYNGTKRFHGFMVLTSVVMVVDIVALVVNPFKNIVVEFVRREPEPLYSKIMYGAQSPLYFLHIALAYVFIFAILGMLFKRLLDVPKEFRRQYTYTVVALVTILVFNALSVFVQGNQGYLNYSVSAYCLMVIFMYLFAYRYSAYIMLSYYKDSVFENVDQALVLFDYRGKLVMRNTKALRMLSNVSFESNMNRAQFEEMCEISVDDERKLESVSMQCFVKSSLQVVSLRCDFRKLRNMSRQLLGYLYIFSDIGLESDPLTGFHNWDSFKNFVMENPKRFSYPLTAIVVDLNNLSVMNSLGGKEHGDQVLISLAEVLRKTFPKESYYVRGENAKLIILCYNMSSKEVDERMDYVQVDFSYHFLYAVKIVHDEQEGLLKAVETADKSLLQKKLVNQDSKHSEVLNALLKALRECNSEMDKHVKNMQYYCKKIGEKLNLSDKEQSDLSLLCVLHDVGNIGVSRELLHKPGSLTREEWRAIQTHVEKGWQIAKSSENFADVADAIRHHHERWDGKGYPDGLTRESIPLLSRIVSVVDSYDAMLSKRAYRPAMTKEDAEVELRACAGHQFDATIVDEFLQILKDEETQEIASEMEENVAPGLVYDAMASMKARIMETEKNLTHVRIIRYSRYIIDANMKIVSVDDMFETMTGYSREDIREGNLTQKSLIPAEDLTEYLCLVAETIANAPIAYFEHRLLCKNGSQIYVFCMGKQFYDSAARETRTEIIINDCSNTYAMRMMANDEKKKAENQRRYWENTYRRDSLTGVLNRSAFQSDVEEKLLDENVKVMLMMIDVDHFKKFNDTYGHRAGDKLLVTIAQIIQKSLRGSDLACRMGGDEFAAALFFDKKCESSFMRVRAQEIFDKISSQLAEEEVSTGLSMGAVIAENSNMTFAQLYESSDKALYKSKGDGRGCLSIIDD